MKLRLLTIALLFAGSLLAQNKWVHHTFDAQTGTGSLTGIHVPTPNGGYPVDHTAVLIVTGSPATCQLSVEGSTNNSNYFSIGDTSETAEADCTASLMFHISGKLVRYVRPNLTTLTGGTSPTVQLIWTGQQR